MCVSLVPHINKHWQLHWVLLYLIKQRPISFSKAQQRIIAVSRLLILFILSVFIASCIQYKIPCWCQRKKTVRFKKGNKNRKHFNVKKNQLSKPLLITRRYSRTPQNHRYGTQSASQKPSTLRQEGTGKWKKKGMMMQTGQVCKECTSSFNNILREKRKKLFLAEYDSPH